MHVTTLLSDTGRKRRMSVMSVTTIAAQQVWDQQRKHQFVFHLVKLDIFIN